MRLLERLCEREQQQGADAVDPGLLRFFERDSSSNESRFEIYGESAQLVADILRLKVSTYEGYDMLSISSNQLALVLHELLLLLTGSQKHRVEIWSFSSMRKSWKISARASPGNIEGLERILGEEWSCSMEKMGAPIVASAVLGLNSGQVGLAIMDSGRMSLSWASFPDSALLNNLETALIQINARECIYPIQRGGEKGTATRDGISALLSGEGSLTTVLGTPLASNEFESDDLILELQKLLLPDIVLCGVEMTREAEMAMAGLVRYLALSSVDENLGIFRLERLQLNNYMRLDETALRALGVFPAGTGKSNEVCLFSSLDQCRTRGGSKLLAQWIRQPLMMHTELENRLNVVQLLVENSSVRQNLRESLLRGIPDISRLVRKVAKGRAGLAELVNLYDVVAKVAPLHEGLLPLVEEGITPPPLIQSLQLLLLQPLHNAATVLYRYGELIQNTVDLAAVERHEYLIRSDFDSQLQALQEQRNQLLDAMEEEFDKIVRKAGLEKGKKIKLERNSTYGFYIRVSRLDGVALQSLEGLQELAALKNGIYCTTPQLRELSLQYDELGRHYSSQQGSLVLEMLKVAQTYRKPFDELTEVLARLDVFQALAYAAIIAPLPYVRPLFVDEEGDLQLQDVRHACLETIRSFIPNSVHFTPEGTLQIITGPNMGGKSTFIRSVALAALMAQIGSFVPCSSATLPLLDALMVRVGAGDSLMRGISTFMMEMLETSSIMQAATSRSLVIIDELGRGTSTSEGCGLAWAIATELAKRRCKCLFATHFFELTELALEQPGVKNLYVEAIIPNEKERREKEKEKEKDKDKDKDKDKEFNQTIDTEGDRDSLMMTFKVKDGACSKSYGIECAQMAGFPEQVLQVAEKILFNLENQRPMTEDLDDL